jgi:translocation and assembly module TamB
MQLTVKRNTWVRNREANVEVYTDDPISVHAEQQAFALTGVVNTDRGEYNFMGKRFQLKRGSATFIGSPDLNPTLQITGEYQVQAATRGTLNISVVIGGTVKRPRLALESDAQPPRTQSELLSLLAFGQPTSTLLAYGTSSVAARRRRAICSARGHNSRCSGCQPSRSASRSTRWSCRRGAPSAPTCSTSRQAMCPLFRGGNPVGNFFKQTRIEAGKYVNGRTFVSVSEQAAQPGVSIAHRTADGWHFSASMVPRIILREPTLREQPTFTTRSYGGFVVREWRF